MQSTPLTPELAKRIETALTLANESRLAQIRELPGNPLGIAARQWGGVRATRVRRGVMYYHHYNTVRGAGAGREPELDAALAWLREHDQRCTVYVSPFDADDALLAHLARRGLRHSRFMSVLYGAPEPSPSAGIHEVRELPPGARGDFLDLWLGDEAGEQRDLLLAIGAAEFAAWHCYVAYVEAQPAAIACLYLHDGTGALASGYTQPRFRGRGLQSALLARRVSDAAVAGCDLIVSQATPGTQSQRNIERAGLRTAYTQAIWLDKAVR